ncbi:hypothetical protein [Persicobacter diffluens]|uniref:Lipocalin-like domain-containing protein n=1 Tax=Persicobacter diffluens TaxID=981 RepID=A0AAN4VUJ3_9BACT|nr:hypothetical protein PEDI_08960 [Persicobacter diffluens]
MKRFYLILLIIPLLYACKDDEDPSPTDPAEGTYELTSVSIFSDGFSQVFEGELLEALIEENEGVFSQMTLEGKEQLVIDGQPVAEKWIRDGETVRIIFGGNQADLVFTWDGANELVWQASEEFEEEAYISQMVFTRINQ